MDDQRVSHVLDELFPLGFSVDRELRFVHLGSRLPAVAPGAVRGATLLSVFHLVRPRIAANYEALCRLQGVALTLRAQGSGLLWRGQRVLDGDLIRFAGGPQVVAFGELESLGLGISDFAPHDPRLDLLMVVASRDAALHDAQILARQLQELNDKETARSRALQGEIVRQEWVASLGRLVAGIAHEVNTPLGVAVTGNSVIQENLRSLIGLARAGTLRRSDLDRLTDKALQACDLTERNLSRAAELVRQFKQVAVDQTSATTREIDVSAYLREVLASLQPLLRGRSVQVNIDAPAAERAITRPGALAQVVTNLLQNALLHAFPDDRSGSITFSVGPEEDDRICLCCIDDGVGMATAVLARIFDPFFTTRMGAGGSGLGLFVVHNLVVDALGGQVQVESTLGRGTAFRVCFPRQRPQLEKESPPLALLPTEDPLL